MVGQSNHTDDLIQFFCEVCSVFNFRAVFMGFRAVCAGGRGRCSYYKGAFVDLRRFSGISALFGRKPTKILPYGVYEIISELGPFIIVS